MTYYGRVRWCDGKWLVTCEPQVRSRARRVFPRATQTAGDVIDLTDTAEHCRELEWFLLRYPMEMSSEDAARLAAGSEQHRDMEERLADLLELRTPPERVTLAEPAREYQLIAGQACEIRGGLLLADHVGVGKTVSGIVPMAHAKNLPAAFVCEPHLARQMERALKRFVPGLQTHRIRKGTPYPLGVRRPALGLSPHRLPDVFIVSYHMLRGWADQLAEIVRYVVYDECQRLRRPESRIYAACQHIARKARMCMGLSATPIYNYGAEFFYVIDCLMEGVLGSRQEFLREWCTGDAGQERLKDPERFGAYLRREGIMLRRSRSDVGRELPKVQRVLHHVDCDQRSLDEMTDSAADLARIILAHNEQFKGQRMRAAGEFDHMMRQATGIAKARYVAAFVRLLLEAGETVIVFGWHREVYRIWAEELKEWRPLMYTGTESPAAKSLAEQEFINGERKLMFMSLRSGAGVDGLQKVCSVVVFGELDWSPGVHEQCIGRLDRDGQERPVMAYFLVADEGSDPLVAEICGIKTEQREGVVNPDAPIVERIDTGENHLHRLARAVLERRGELDLVGGTVANA